MGMGGRMKTKAFTLIELLVVIAIISILFAIIMPTLHLAKRHAGTTVCLSNTKNLSLGWFMYSGDNDNRIMSSEDAGTERSGKFVGWCAGASILTPGAISAIMESVHSVHEKVRADRAGPAR